MENNDKKIKIFIIPIIIIGILTAFDQLTKFIIISKFELYETRTVINKLLNFTYIQNDGVAWGMFKGKRTLFLILTVIALLVIFRVYYNICNSKKYLPIKIFLIMLASGALGNMIDRIMYGYVIDFFDVQFIDFPVFNFADILVTVSGIFLFILLLFKYSSDEFDEIFNFKIKNSDKDI